MTLNFENYTIQKIPPKTANKLKTQYYAFFVALLRPMHEVYDNV